MLILSGSFWAIAICSVISISHNKITIISQGYHSRIQACLNWFGSKFLVLTPSPCSFCDWSNTTNMFKKGSREVKKSCKPTYFTRFPLFSWMENLRDQLHFSEKSSQHFTLTGPWASNTNSKLLFLPCLNDAVLIKILFLNQRLTSMVFRIFSETFIINTKFMTLKRMYLQF